MLLVSVFIKRLYTDVTGLRVSDGLKSNSQKTHLAGPRPHSAATMYGEIPSLSNMMDI